MKENYFLTNQLKKKKCSNRKAFVFLRMENYLSVLKERKAARVIFLSLTQNNPSILALSFIRFNKAHVWNNKNRKITRKSRRIQFNEGSLKVSPCFRSPVSKPFLNQYIRW